VIKRISNFKNSGEKQAGLRGKKKKKLHTGAGIQTLLLNLGKIYHVGVGAPVVKKRGVGDA